MSEVFGTLEICVVLEGFIDREVTVNFFTVDGTAIGISSCVYIIFPCFSKFHTFYYNNFYRTNFITFVELYSYTVTLLYKECTVTMKIEVVYISELNFYKVIFLQTKNH